MDYRRLVLRKYNWDSIPRHNNKTTQHNTSNETVITSIPGSLLHNGIFRGRIFRFCLLITLCIWNKRLEKMTSFHDFYSHINIHY